MNHTTLILTVFSFLLGILVFAIWSNGYVYAQQSSSTSPSSVPMPSSPSVAKVKITSPTRGQQVPVGKDLTISGTSIDNATYNNDCKVSVIANKVRPYQLATATGPGGAADYSKWNFVLTSKYTTIKPGPNRITAKYECANNAASTSFSSVNVTGVQQHTGTTTAGTIATNKSTTTTTPTATTTTSTAAKTQISSSLSSPQQQTTTPKLTTTAAASVAAAPKQQPILLSTNNTNNTISRTTNAATGVTMALVSNPTANATSSSPSSSSPISIAPQVEAVNQQQQQQQEQPQLLTIRNDTAGQNYTGINSTAGQNDAFSATPSVVASGKLMYLGYHGADSIPTNGDSSPNDKSSSDSKPSVHSSSSTTSDNDSIGRKKSSSDIRSDRTDSTSDDGSSKDKVSPDTKLHTPHQYHTNDNSNSKENDDSSDIKSSSHNDDSSKSSPTIINNDIPSVIVKSFNFKHSTDSDSSKSSSHYANSSSTTTDNDSTEKKKTSSTKLDRADSTNGESSSKKDNSSSTSDSRSSRRTNDGIELSSSSDFASASRNKVDPTIINSQGESRHSLFGFSDYGF